jgi:outer membrane protein assembly factor BamB
MKRLKITGRVLAGVATIAVFGLVLVFWKPGQQSPVVSDVNAADQAGAMARMWPLFGGTPQRNMVNLVDRNVPDDWQPPKIDRDGKILEKGKNIKWVAALGSRAYGGPVISSGRILVGTNNHAPRDPKITGDKGIIMCFNEADGKFLWQIVHDKLTSSQVNDWPFEGVCATPVIDGDYCYYTSNRCEVVCAEMATGKIVWLLDMRKDLNVFPHNMTACSPVIVGDLLFVVTANGVDEGHVNIPEPQAPSFIAVEKKTGKVKWKDNSPGKFIMHGQWSNPTYAVDAKGKGQIIFPGGDGWLRAFEPETGKLIWQFDANPKDSKYDLGARGTKSDFIATPVVIGDKLIIGTGQDPEHYEGIGHLWCISISKTGDVSPDLVVDPKASPVKTKPNPNSAAIWHYGGPTTKEDRDKIQRDYYFGRTMSTVAVHDGLVYAAELAGYVHCLDFQTGKPNWVFDMKAAVWGSTCWVDNKVYIATEEGDIWIFPHGKAKPQGKRVEMGQAVRSTPVVVNGVLYVMSESNLYAIAAK